MNRLRWTICFLLLVVVGRQISIEVFSQGVTVPKRPAKPQPDVKLNASPPKVQFQDIAYKAGLTARHVTGAQSEKKYIIETTGSGVALFDYDNDGWLDLLVANGHVYPTVDATDWGTSYKQRLLLFRNLNGKFRETGSSAGAALYVLRSARGSAVGDFDNDGDPDILLNNMDDSPALLRNDGANKSGHWLTLRLVGDVTRKCSRDAIGTTVFLTTKGRRLRGEVASGRSYNSQSDLRVHFGLGAATKVEKLEVRWANGEPETYEIKNVNKVLVIEQGRRANSAMN